MPVLPHYCCGLCPRTSHSGLKSGVVSWRNPVSLTAFSKNLAASTRPSRKAFGANCMNQSMYKSTEAWVLFTMGACGAGIGCQTTGLPKTSVAESPLPGLCSAVATTRAGASGEPPAQNKRPDGHKSDSASRERDSRSRNSGGYRRGQLKRNGMPCPRGQKRRLAPKALLASKCTP